MATAAMGIQHFSTLYPASPLVSASPKVDNGLQKTYLYIEAGMGKQKIKRIADFLEKLAVAGIALGIFQENYSGIAPAVAFFFISLTLTREA